MGEFKDKDGNISKTLNPKPIITFLDTQTKEDQVITYGLGINRNSTMKVKIREEVCNAWFNCIFGGWQWETKETIESENIDHAEIKLYKEGQATELGQLWNDDPPHPQGKWKHDSISIGTNDNQINYGEKLCVSSFIHGNLDGGRSWWHNIDVWSEVSGGCRRVIDPKDNLSFQTHNKSGSIVYAGLVKNESKGNLRYSIKIKNSSDDLNNLVNDHPEKTNLVFGINGDYKDNSKSAEGYNLDRSNTLAAGEYKDSRTLKIDQNNIPKLDKSFSYAQGPGLSSDYNVLGGGFKVIQDGNFVFNVKCYLNAEATDEVDCTIQNQREGKIKATRLNGEPVKLEDGKDYENSEDLLETGFMATTGQTLIGITDNNDLVMAVCPGYSFKKNPIAGTFFGSYGCSTKDLAEVLIDEYNVKEAYRPDGGTEASVYYNGKVYNGKDLIPEWVKNLASISGNYIDADIPSALLIHDK